MIRRESSMPRELECGFTRLPDGETVRFRDWPRLLLFTIERTGELAIGLVDEDNSMMIRCTIEPDNATTLGENLIKLAGQQIEAAGNLADAAIAKAKGGAA